ncbi:hypothetical protein STENM36S_04190 [Streptomyces tendae]
MARSSVDLPEPLEPIRPMASPRYAVKETPRTACTLRTPRAASSEPLLSMRLRAAVALPLPVLAPLTR